MQQKQSKESKFTSNLTFRKRIPGRPGARKFPGWPGTITSSPEIGAPPPPPPPPWVLLRIATKICANRVQISLEIGIYYAEYQNLGLIFATARKHIFGKLVSLGSKYSSSLPGNQIFATPWARPVKIKI